MCIGTILINVLVHKWYLFYLCVYVCIYIYISHLTCGQEAPCALKGNAFQHSKLNKLASFYILSMGSCHYLQNLHYTLILILKDLSMTSIRNKNFQFNVVYHSTALLICANTHFNFTTSSQAAWHEQSMGYFLNSLNKKYHLIADS